MEFRNTFANRLLILSIIVNIFLVYILASSNSDSSVSDASHRVFVEKHLAIEKNYINLINSYNGLVNEYNFLADKNNARLFATPVLKKEFYPVPLEYRKDDEK